MENIERFIKDTIYDDYLSLNIEYKGYSVYEPIFNEGMHYIGFPNFILKKNSKIRWTTREEAIEIYLSIEDE